MRVVFAALASLALALACAEPKPAAPSADDVRAAIETQNRSFGETVRARDAAAIGALYAEDGAALPPGGAVVSGRAALAQFWGGVLESGIASVVLTTEEVVYAGGDTASEVGSAVLSAADGSVADEGKYIVLWKQTPEGWRMYRDIWNSSRAPAPPADATPAATAPDAAAESPSAAPTP
ncbi:MAG TPA: DUF4440 domain-containing protein [Myxococcota bacterium]|jgi:uncharacterized protein (TIGR02246 family)